jgi:glycosylphosphatidylinositol transamidase
MLSRLRRARPVLTSVNYTPEHASLAKTIGRRKAIVDGVAAKLPYLR